jgi:putative addiction module antidote
LKRTLFKSGNSTVIALPKEMVEHLGITLGDKVELVFGAEDREIILKPAESHRVAGSVDEDFARQVAEFIEEYRSALDALARQ